MSVVLSLSVTCALSFCLLLTFHQPIFCFLCLSHSLSPVFTLLHPLFFFCFNLLLFTFHTPSVMLSSLVDFLCLQPLCLSSLIPPTLRLCYSVSFFLSCCFFCTTLLLLFYPQLFFFIHPTNNSESMNQFTIIL